MESPTRKRAQRWLATVLVGALVIGPAEQAFAATTALADVPIAAKVAAKPNIVYTVDDSGSMNFTFLPDFVTGSYCRSGNNLAACSAIPLANSNFFWPPVLAEEFNHLAYNPDINYTPPRKYDGSAFTNTNTDAQGNQPYTLAQDEPFLAPQPGTRRNLTATVTVPIYCNTDWPVTVARNLSLTNDVADANGEYKAGTGGYCRINGVAYDASAASGAPAIAEGYNYPYQSSSGAKGAQYFYQNIGVKSLWCDKTSPYWPRNTNIVGCTAGGTPTCGGVACPTTPQTCNRKAKTCDPTPSARVWNDARCGNVGAPPAWDPALFCAPGVGGSTAQSPGTATIASECSSCVCQNTYQPSGGNCSITGAACNGPYGISGGDPAECPAQPVAPNGCSAGVPIFGGAAGSSSCSAFLWDPAAGVYSNQVGSTIPATTLEQDANGNGYACRHNNQTYAVTGLPAAGGLFTYPRTNINDVYAANKTGIAPYTQTGAFNVQTTSGCPTVGNQAIPRHYYILSSVQFCNTQDLTADIQWRGFGTGVCTPKNDFVTNKYIQYGTFKKVGIVNDGRTFPYTDQVTGQALTRTYAQETQNYANWYSYYRSRILATKTTSSIAFSFLDDTYRVGFQNYGLEPNPWGPGGAITWVDVKDWVLGLNQQRDKWYQALFGLSPTAGKTPTISAMLRIGNLFATGGAGGLPSEVAPLPGGAADPITLSCQSNYHILFTDGFTNQVAQAAPAWIGNQDSKIAPWSATIVDNPLLDNQMPNLRAGVGGSWSNINTYKAPFAENPAPVSVPNSLSDIATYYWVTDLRPALKNDVPGSPVKLDLAGKTTDDIDPNKDIAWWQHLNFNAISFGSEGVLNATTDIVPASSPPVSYFEKTLADVTAGTQNWTPTLTVPANSANPYNPNNPPGNPSGGPSAVDDLWHATVNSRGKFVYAKSPLEVSYGLANILAGISNQRKSRSGAAFGGQVLDATNNIIYEATIESGWAGDLLKVQIDPSTGAEVATLWRANFQLGRQIDRTLTGQAEPWFTNRRVVTNKNAPGNPGAANGIPFLDTKLTAAQLASLSPDPTQQKKIIAYLRGGSTYGVAPSPVTVIEGTKIGQFRARPSAGKDPVDGHAYPAGLGDLSNASPVIVGPPTRPYKDVTDFGYTAWAASKASRSTVIVAAANDGMVHVVEGDTGNEVFGYIPSALFRGVAGNPVTEDRTAIQALTYQDGGVPIFHHHFYVDSSPRVADVDFTNGAGDWHTIVVGGLGKGGNSYYALDLTDPAAPDENAAAAKVLWEWTDPDIKYTYGRPVIVKVRDSAFPSGRWVVMVTAGYNNVSGFGKVFVLDARTGTKLSTFTTSVGSGVNPSGLAQIHAFVKDFTNQVAEQIYGGDLLGNMWRIDVSATDSYKTAVPVLFAKLTDSGGNPQPITTAPQIEIDLNNGIDRFVFIGTGQLLDTTDLTVPTPPQQQTMYAIRDGSLTSFLTAGLPIAPRVTMSPVNPDLVSAIVGGAPNGWYQDLPSTPPDAERIVVDVQADVNIALYVGTQIQNDPCVISLPATIYARDFTSGKSLLASGGLPLPSLTFSKGTVGTQIVGRIQADGTQTLGALLSTEIPGTQPIDVVNPVTGPGNRLSWRLLTGQ